MDSEQRSDGYSTYDCLGDADDRRVELAQIHGSDQHQVELTPAQEERGEALITDLIQAHHSKTNNAANAASPSQRTGVPLSTITMTNVAPPSPTTTTVNPCYRVRRDASPNPRSVSTSTAGPGPVPSVTTVVMTATRRVVKLFRMKTDWPAGPPVSPHSRSAVAISPNYSNRGSRLRLSVNGITSHPRLSTNTTTFDRKRTRCGNARKS